MNIKHKREVNAIESAEKKLQIAWEEKDYYTAQQLYNSLYTR